MDLTMKFERIKKGIKQRELAEKAGVTQQYITALENGRQTNPTRKVMIAISEALEISVQELFFNQK